MTHPNWTAEKLQRLILNQHASTSIEAIEALRAFAKRIAQDEKAVPYCYTCEQKNHLSQGAMCRSAEECRASPLFDPEYDHVIPLYLHPPSQPEAREMEGWQPIETAPKDGTAVIFYDEDEPHIGRWWIQRGHVSCWSSDSWEPGSCDPKYWMPLPSTEPRAKES